MGTFKHLPSNYILINDGLVCPAMTLAFFLTLNPTYALPAGATSRQYVQGSWHVTSNGVSSTDQGIPYANGDTYIANEVAYAAAYSSYLNPAPSLADAKITRINSMEDYATTIKQGKILISANEYFSDDAFLSRLLRDDIVYSNAGALPVGYYINTTSYVQIATPLLIDLEAVISRIQELQYLCELNADVHRAAINALGTVPLVQAYDYTTGWPSIPY